MDEKSLQEILEWKIREMAKIRDLKIAGIKRRIEDLAMLIGRYGCVIAALVYLF
ncbi:hypothetical protein J7K52_04570 [Candidatus Bathyarchaeota archaeon]|nr:hypothetical protein [Candidatus Bathyarchaeota archaeon]